MRILFVTLFPLENNTSVTKSNYGIIKGLSDLGHHITIMMPKMSLKNGSYDAAYNLETCKIIRIGEKPFGEIASINNVGALWYKIKRKLHKEFDILDQTRVYLPEADKIDIPNEKFDVVISTSDPKASHLFVKRLIARGLKYDRWIQHWGDPLNGDITRKNCYPDKVIQWYEKRIIKCADKIIYVSPFTSEVQKQVYSQIASKIAFVPLPCEEIDESSERVSDNDSLRLSYLGDYNLSIRDIRPLYETCCEAKDVDLTIAGHSGLKLKERENVHIFPRVPLARVREIEKESDVLVSVGNLRGTQIPGKIYYTAATKKHILVIVDGDNIEQMKEYLNQYRRFIVCDNNAQSIKMAIEKIKGLQCTDYETPSVLIPINNAEIILGL